MVPLTPKERRYIALVLASLTISATLLTIFFVAGMYKQFYINFE